MNSITYNDIEYNIKYHYVYDPFYKPVKVESWFNKKTGSFFKIINPSSYYYVIENDQRRYFICHKIVPNIRNNQEFLDVIECKPTIYTLGDVPENIQNSKFEITNSNELKVTTGKVKSYSKIINHSIKNESHIEYSVFQTNCGEEWFSTEYQCRHREDGPAYITKEGYQAWYYYGHIFRDFYEGPAIIYADGTETYYHQGEILSQMDPRHPNVREKILLVINLMNFFKGLINDPK